MTHPAILGGDFMGNFGSAISYKALEFRLHADKPGVPVLERQVTEPHKLQCSTIRRVEAIAAQPRLLSRPRAARLDEDLTLEPATERLARVVLDPPFQGDYEYAGTGLLTASQRLRSGKQRDGTGVADAVVTVTPNGHLYTPALCLGHRPVTLKKGTIMGIVTELPNSTVIQEGTAAHLAAARQTTLNPPQSTMPGVASTHHSHSQHSQHPRLRLLLS